MEIESRPEIKKISKPELLACLLASIVWTNKPKSEAEVLKPIGIGALERFKDYAYGNINIAQLRGFELREIAVENLLVANRLAVYEEGYMLTETGENYLEKALEVIDNDHSLLPSLQETLQKLIASEQS